MIADLLEVSTLPKMNIKHNNYAAEELAPWDDKTPPNLRFLDNTSRSLCTNQGDCNTAKTQTIRKANEFFLNELSISSRHQKEILNEESLFAHNKFVLHSPTSRRMTQKRSTEIIPNSYLNKISKKRFASPIDPLNRTTASNITTITEPDNLSYAKRETNSSCVLHAAQRNPSVAGSDFKIEFLNARSSFYESSRSDDSQSTNSLLEKVKTKLGEVTRCTMRMVNVYNKEDNLDTQVFSKLPKLDSKQPANIISEKHSNNQNKTQKTRDEPFLSNFNSNERVDKAWMGSQRLLPKLKPKIMNHRLLTKSMIVHGSDEKILNTSIDSKKPTILESKKTVTQSINYGPDLPFGRPKVNLNKSWIFNRTRSGAHAYIRMIL